MVRTIPLGATTVTVSIGSCFESNRCRAGRVLPRCTRLGVAACFGKSGWEVVFRRATCPAVMFRNTLCTKVVILSSSCFIFTHACMTEMNLILACCRVSNSNQVKLQKESQYNSKPSGEQEMMCFQYHSCQLHPSISNKIQLSILTEHLQVWRGLEGRDVARCWPLDCLQVAQHRVELLAHIDPPVILILMSILCAVHTMYAFLQRS